MKGFQKASHGNSSPQYPISTGTDYTLNKVEPLGAETDDMESRSRDNSLSWNGHRHDAYNMPVAINTHSIRPYQNKNTERELLKASSSKIFSDQNEEVLAKSRKNDSMSNNFNELLTFSEDSSANIWQQRNIQDLKRLYNEFKENLAEQEQPEYKNLDYLISVIDNLSERKKKSQKNTLSNKAKKILHSECELRRRTAINLGLLAISDFIDESNASKRNKKKIIFGALHLILKLKLRNVKN